MEHFAFSTAVVPAREQYGFWRDSFRVAVCGFTSEPVREIDRGFGAAVEAWVTPSIERFRTRADHLMVVRGAREIARQNRDSIWIFQERDAPVCFQHDGSEFVGGAGDLVITDADHTFSIRADHQYCHDVWVLPKALVAPYLSSSERSLWFTSRTGGIAGVLGAVLESLARDMSALSAEQWQTAADHVSRLLVVICGAPQGEHRHALQHAFLERAKQHITRHLADPELRPETAAAALGVSLRKLHLAFEPSGDSFASFVMRRRLAACRAALASPGEANRSVADIAFGWGFRSLATFNRAFRREYELAPSEVREAAQRGGR